MDDSLLNEDNVLPVRWLYVRNLRIRTSATEKQTKSLLLLYNNRQ